MSQPPPGGPGAGAHEPPGGSAAGPPGHHGGGRREPPQERHSPREDGTAPPHSGRQPGATPPPEGPGEPPGPANAAGWAAPGAGPEHPGGHRPPYPAAPGPGSRAGAPRHGEAPGEAAGPPPQAPPPDWPAPGTAPGAEPISPKPAQSRGCATAVVAVLAVVVLLLVGAGVWAIVALSSAESGDYDAAPDCSAAPDEVLDALVPARETELNQQITDFDPERRDGYECRWATPETAAQVPAAARLVLVRYADRIGTPGAESASTALKAATRDQDAHNLSGIGDEAKAWNESLRGFDWGCVGVRMSNLYAMACHTAAADYQASVSIPAGLALSNAESLARAVTDEIEQGDY